jgi:plastocyanin
MRKLLFACVACTVAVALSACGGEDETGGEEEAGNGGRVTLEGERANDHGTEDVSGADSIEFEMDDFYFEPTVLEGDAGQQITLEAFNEGEQRHNLTIEDQGIDEDVEPGAQTEIEVTLPDSGTLLFVCKYHAGQGMRGALRVTS